MHTQSLCFVDFFFFLFFFLYFCFVSILLSLWLFYHFHFHFTIYRFVEPFSDLIHSWEKSLSLIFEIIDQWINFTQRKWLYLEGIFIDNDARIKLPTIAMKFDMIDAEYIKVYLNSKTFFFSFYLFIY